MIKLHDRVFVKTQNAIGYVVDITGEFYAVEKEGNAGPIYWGLSLTDLIPVDRLKEEVNPSTLSRTTATGSMTSAKRKR